jgi:hypothetical protein
LAFDIFNPKAQPLIGLDISSSSVKLVEVADAGKEAYRIERYAIEPLPKDAVLDGNITNLEVVAEAVKRAWKKMATRTRNVAMALPAAAVITKKIVVPAGLRDEELEIQVETEANQYIPFALDEVNLDFQVVGPSPTSTEEVEVIIAASRKEKVEDRVEVAEMCGLRPVVVDIAGTTLTPAERVRLRDPLVGMVILFTRNYESPAQLAALTAEIHALRDPALVIAVDHEGGRVQRFRGHPFTRLPAMAELGWNRDDLLRVVDDAAKGQHG